MDTWYHDRYRATGLPDYTNRTFAPELAEHPVLLALYYDSGLAQLVDQLLSPAPATPAATAQVQIRLPDAAP
ncbi:hypothetical protein [Streptomyces mobaraensis]|uniref:Uncharacterized protein n=1 Tax=Streptomyces mobaraensis TaxID=35621 RepID=A0A5N5W1A8_STRMB|nr:hypothetical protein [Streptomyces mobaraensis]KAB7835580.1 hypothetical protein FRZ00_27250 [Streptomyces mobaraensis]